MVKVAPASTEKCQSDICSITWTKNPGGTVLSCPGDSSFPIRSRGPHTSWPEARESNGRNNPSLLRLSKATRSRTRSRLNICNLSWLLLSCVHTGHQIGRLWLVSGPQLCPGRQATDVTLLLFPKQSPQGNRQTLLPSCWQTSGTVSGQPKAWTCRAHPASRGQTRCGSPEEGSSMCDRKKLLACYLLCP
jgi:hypothetical protein